MLNRARTASKIFLYFSENKFCYYLLEKFLIIVLKKIVLAQNFSYTGSKNLTPWNVKTQTC